jgi:hypothetical protein
MSSDADLAVGVGLAMLFALFVTALALVYLAWRVARARGWPRWVSVTVLPVGIVLGIAGASVVVFDDLGERLLASYSAPAIEVQVPQGYRGPVLVFFVDGEPTLQPISANRYRLEVPKSGSLLTGTYPEFKRFSSYAKYEVSYPDGTRPRLTTPSLSGGTFNDASFARFFVGNGEEYRDHYEVRLAQGRLLDERELLRTLQAERAGKK